MMLTNVEIDLEDVFHNLSSSEQEDFAEYVFDNLSGFHRKLFMSFIATNYPDLIEYIEE